METNSADQANSALAQEARQLFKAPVPGSIHCQSKLVARSEKSQVLSSKKTYSQSIQVKCDRLDITDRNQTEDYKMANKFVSNTRSHRINLLITSAFLIIALIHLTASIPAPVRAELDTDQLESLSEAASDVIESSEPMSVAETKAAGAGAGGAVVSKGGFKKGAAAGFKAGAKGAAGFGAKAGKKAGFAKGGAAAAAGFKKGGKKGGFATGAGYAAKFGKKGGKFGSFAAGHKKAFGTIKAFHHNSAFKFGKGGAFGAAGGASKGFAAKKGFAGAAGAAGFKKGAKGGAKGFAAGGAAKAGFKKAAAGKAGFKKGKFVVAKIAEESNGLALN